MDPVKDFFIVPIDNISALAKKQRVNTPLTFKFAGAANQKVETEYNSDMCLILLTAEQLTAANAYNISCVPTLILDLHACAGFPVIVT